MITKIEALNYRCLPYVSQALGPFHVLVGPNGSGKSAFLDMVAFLADVVGEDLGKAVLGRTQNFYDLVWKRRRGRLELALEVSMPQELRELPAHRGYGAIRYET